MTTNNPNTPGLVEAAEAYIAALDSKNESEADKLVEIGCMEQRLRTALAASRTAPSIGDDAKKPITDDEIAVLLKQVLTPEPDKDMGMPTDEELRKFEDLSEPNDERVPPLKPGEPQAATAMIFLMEKFKSEIKSGEVQFPQGRLVTLAIDEFGPVFVARDAAIQERDAIRVLFDKCTIALNAVTQERDALNKRVEELTGALPKTADGVVIVPGMVLFIKCPFTGIREYGPISGVSFDFEKNVILHRFDETGNNKTYTIRETLDGPWLFSTREAALSASGNGNGGTK